MLKNKQLPRLILLALIALSALTGFSYQNTLSQLLTPSIFSDHQQHVFSLYHYLFGVFVGSGLVSIFNKKITRPLVVFAFLHLILLLIGITQAYLFNFFPLVITSFLQHIVTSSYWQRELIIVTFIQPYTILWGMGIPLLLNAVIRRYPHLPGKTICLIFANYALGIILSILLSQWLLYPSIGWLGALLIASGCQGLVFIIALLLSRMKNFNFDDRPLQFRSVKPPQIKHFINMQVINLLAGAAVCICLYAWLRMNVLIYGNVNQQLLYMLLIFMAGFLGGLIWLRNRIDHLQVPLYALGSAQIILGFFALLILLLLHYGLAFIENTSYENFANPLVHLINHYILTSLLMLPAAIWTSLTLPLSIYSLLKRGHGEKSLSSVYASYHLGGFIGIMIVGQYLISVVDIRELILASYSVQLLIGLLFLWWVRIWHRKTLYIAILSCLTILLISLIFHYIYPVSMGHELLKVHSLWQKETGEITFQKHSGQHTVSIINSDGHSILAFNQKPQLYLSKQNAKATSPTRDDISKTLAAAIPMSLQPDARRILTMGINSALTAHVYLTFPTIDSVDILELIPTHIQAVKKMGEMVKKTFSDPRSHIFITDGKTFFAKNKNPYDIIVVETANPWLGDIIGLYSDEFYETVKNHLNPQGLLVQWLQLKELNMSLLAAIFQTVGKQFQNYVIYNTDDNNLLLIASKHDAIEDNYQNIFSIPEVKQELIKRKIYNVHDFTIRRLGNKAILQDYFNSIPTHPLSAYLYSFDLIAPASNDTSFNATELLNLSKTDVIELLEIRKLPWTNIKMGMPYSQRYQKRKLAIAIYKSIINGKVRSTHVNLPLHIVNAIKTMRSFSHDCHRLHVSSNTWSSSLYTIASHTQPYLTTNEFMRMWYVIGNKSCLKHISKQNLNWYLLFSAVARRNMPQIQQLSETLLQEAKMLEFSKEQQYYLLMIAMASHIATGNNDYADNLWKKYSPDIIQTSSDKSFFMVFKMLEAMAKKN